MMNTISEPQRIAVFFCKDFTEVVRKKRAGEPVVLETLHMFLDGYTDSNGDIHLPQEQADRVLEATMRGFAVTAYLRLSDLYCYIPFADDEQTSVAVAVNERILDKVRRMGPLNSGALD